ncbi:MAG: alpha/beta hydrolase [Nitrospinales bacterium]
MLFVTNRNFKEGKESTLNRKVTFDLNDTDPSNSAFFCQRRGKDNYIEVLCKNFLDTLKKSSAKQILLYIHGFNNLPERDIFPRAVKLQKLCDGAGPGLIEVVPLIWPCDNDLGIIKDYWDDQKAAEASAHSFSRVFSKFLAWRDGQPENDPCYKRINILAHSMGNRVLRFALESWARDYGAVPGVFRNIFMAAADVVNETLERGESGRHISDAARNVAVYYANDDFALRSSKVTNLKNKVVSRRLGHTGPEDMSRVAKNVYAIDCDNFNNTYDSPTGHAYFLTAPGNRPGAVFKHMFHALKTGRVDADPQTRALILKRNYKAPKA